MISESQAGFRDGYSTIDNLFILQGVRRKYLSKRRGNFMSVLSTSNLHLIPYIDTNCVCHLIIMA